MICYCFLWIQVFGLGVWGVFGDLKLLFGWRSHPTSVDYNHCLCNRRLGRFRGIWGCSRFAPIGFGGRGVGLWCGVGRGSWFFWILSRSKVGG